jgi:hypothetical protein
MPDNENQNSTQSPTPDEKALFSKVMAINPAHQPAVDKIATAFLRAELKATEQALAIATSQKYILDTARSIGVHPSSLTAGVYKKDYATESNEGIIKPLGEAMQMLNEVAYCIAEAHKNATRVLCDLKIINDSGGGK